MLGTELNSPDKAIKDRITRLINYRLSEIEVDILMLNKGKETTLREEIIQQRKNDEKVLKDCLSWIIGQ